MTDNDQAREALKPCPFCGKKPVSFVTGRVYCQTKNCPCGQGTANLDSWNRRAPLQHEAIPEGWKLVPIEPSDAMFDAGYESLKDNHNTGQFGECGGFTYGDADQCYRAMIAAAPLPAQIKDE